MNITNLPTSSFYWTLVWERRSPTEKEEEDHSIKLFKLFLNCTRKERKITCLNPMRLYVLETLSNSIQPSRDKLWHQHLTVIYQTANFNCLKKYFRWKRISIINDTTIFHILKSTSIFLKIHFSKMMTYL